MRCRLLGVLSLLAARGASAQLKPLPLGRPAGTVRVWESGTLEPVARAWARGFEAAHPGLHVELHPVGTDVAMAGLTGAQADVVLSGRVGTDAEVKGFEWLFRYRPTVVEVATGSVGRAGLSPAVAVLVPRANPLRAITLEQLAAVFGSEGKTLGFDGKLATGGNVTTWGGLGLTGAWAQRPIHLYTPDSESGTMAFFRRTVLGDSSKMAWDRLREFDEPVLPVSRVDTAGKRIAATLLRDPEGMALGNLADAGPGLRAVPVADAAGKPVALTPETVRDRSYPFARPILALVNRPAGKAADPDVAAFVAFALSAEGQRMAAAAGLEPLTPALAESSSQALADTR